jgi:hypothetical protein
MRRYLDILRQIVTHPVPYRPDPEIEAMGKKRREASKASVKILAHRKAKLHSSNSSICQGRT